MKKIMSLMIIALISLLSLQNTFGGESTEEGSLFINGEQILDKKEALSVIIQKDNSISYIYKENDKVKGKISNTKINADINEYSEKSDVLYKNYNSNVKFNPENIKIKIDIKNKSANFIINKKEYGPYKINEKLLDDGLDRIDSYCSETIDFGYTCYIEERMRMGIPPHTDTFIFTNKFLSGNKKQETKKQIKAIPKIDKILNNFFAKIDKKGEAKAQIIYKKILKKIDSLILKTKSSKNKKILNYLKVKFEEKIK